MEITKETIKEVLAANKDLDPAEAKRQQEVMEKIFIDGLLPKDAMGISQSSLNKVYKYAYTLYQTRKYADAAQLFEWLKMMNPDEENYTIALMHCHIQLKQWVEALTMQLEIAFRHPDNPFPYSMMCDCLMEAGDNVGAMTAIRAAILRAGDNPKYAKEKEKWKLTYNYLLGQLNIDPAKAESLLNEEESDNKK